MTQTDSHDLGTEATGTAPLTGGTVAPTNFAAQNNAESTHSARERTLATLASLADSAAHYQGDALDALGQIRLVELAAQQARRAVIDAALSNGVTRQQIADTLAIDLEAFEQRYGCNP